MPKLNIGFSLKFQTKGLKSKIIKAVAKELRPKFWAVARNVGPRIRRKFAELILQHDTIQAILNGDQLQAELGLNRPKNRIDNIILSWVKGLRIRIRSVVPSTTGVKGILRMEMVRSDWAEVNQLPSAWVTEYTIKPLDWLNWLLTRGGETIIQDYDVVFQRGRGRTGLAFMTKISGRKWNVPAQFQGVQDNNFATQTIEKLYKEMPLLIEEEFKKVL